LIAVAAGVLGALLLFGYGVAVGSAPALIAAVVILLAALPAALIFMVLRYRQPMAPAQRRRYLAPNWRAGAITRPATLVIARPDQGWLAGLLHAGMLAIAGLAAVLVALVVASGTTAVLWMAGQVRIAVVAIAYGAVIAAATGYAAGRSARLHSCLARLPEGPPAVGWPTSVGDIETGLTWERDEYARYYSDDRVTTEQPSLANKGDWEPASGARLLPPGDAFTPEDNTSPGDEAL